MKKEIIRTIIMIILMLFTVANAIRHMLDQGGWLSILTLVCGSCGLLMQIVILIRIVKERSKVK